MSSFGSGHYDPTQSLKQDFQDVKEKKSINMVLVDVKTKTIVFNDTKPGKGEGDQDRGGGHYPSSVKAAGQFGWCFCRGVFDR